MKSRGLQIKTLGAVCMLALAGFSMAPARAQATFRVIWVTESTLFTGQIRPDATPIPRESYAGMSADGSALAGAAGSSSYFMGADIIASEAFRRVGDTHEKLGFPPDSTSFRRTEATGISADGQVVVGSSGTWLGVSGPGPEAFRWTVATGTQRLFATRLPMSAAMAASADGSSIVGYYDLADSRRRAFRWTAGGVTQLEPLPGDAMAEAFGVSGDGTVVVGESGDVTGYHSCLWTDGGPAVDLGYLSGIAHVSEARAVSADGKVIVGALGDRPKKQLAFRWTADGGMQALGDISPSAATAVSADGSAIFGTSNGEAFHWDATHGKQSLAALLTAAGADLGGLHLDDVIAVSADGSIILGNGTYPRAGIEIAFGYHTPRTAVWLAQLPVVPDLPEADVPSEYLPESPATPASSEPPTLGKKRIIAFKSRLIATGIARGDVTEVTCRIGDDGAFKTAAGTNVWRFTARLSPGRNVLTIIAHGPGGDSDPIRIVVTRK